MNQLSICQCGDCAVTGAATCCKDCGELQICVTKWGSACLGETADIPLLCVYFDAKRGECGMLECGEQYDPNTGRAFTDEDFADI